MKIRFTSAQVKKTNLSGTKELGLVAQPGINPRHNLLQRAVLWWFAWGLHGLKVNTRVNLKAS